MEKHELLELTTLIDDCNYSNNTMITVEMLHERLWPGLNKLRMTPNKDDLIGSWKYKSDILSTERSHANSLQSFTNVDWENSYVLAFWMGIYH